MLRTNLPLLAVALSAFVITSCGPAQQADTASAPAAKQGQAYVVDETSKPNILQIAAGSEDHTTLVAAVEAAELENVLVNAGPLTVFAPTNDAFDKLPAGTVDDLLKPENKSKLAKIVTSHAAPGTYKGDLLKDGMKLYQATGHYVDVEVKDGDTFVNGAKVLATVDASNGVVHVVDQVFLLVE
ncbi:MAG: fasciclin domain-containing protein [Rhodothermia bacterium]|nr:fasciclin domain-containing protein [Rhodothermia bacterium]